MFCDQYFLRSDKNPYQLLLKVYITRLETWMLLVSALLRCPSKVYKLGLTIVDLVNHSLVSSDILSSVWYSRKSAKIFNLLQDLTVDIEIYRTHGMATKSQNIHKINHFGLGWICRRFITVKL